MLHELLLELGNSRFDYTVDKSDDLVTISAMNGRLQIYFSRTPHGHVFIEFWVDGDRHITGRGGDSTIKILSTVVDALKKELPGFIKPSVKSVHFAAESSEPSRVKLYKRAAPIVSGILGNNWQFSEDNTGSLHEFNWTRKSVRESQLDMFNKVYYVMVNGKIWKKQGKPVEFASYKLADQAVLSIIDKYGKAAQVIDPDRYPVR